ncbi:TPA: DUF551 domain-containing protein [Raoultella planticola]
MTSKLTITDERVISVIERLEHYACNLKWTNVRGAQDLLTAADGLRELQERRKAAMDSEPVAWTSETALSDVACEETSMIGHEGVVGSIPLYRHAQQPVVPDAYVRDERGRMMLNGVCEPKIGFSAGWNACLAAMLQELPKSAGESNNCRSSENVQVMQVMQDVSRCSTKSAPALDSPPKTAESRVGNSPVIPDGYVMVPVKPTREILDEFDSIIDYGAEDSEDAWRRLLAAAPQPQNAPQNIPEIIPGWIPVSERMPDDDDFVYIWPRPDFGVELHVGQYCECSPKGDGWYAQVYEQNYGIEWHPITVTHWMPLPNPPKEEK